MKKIIVIGCPGSGKSTLVFKLKELLGFETMHLDKVYHIDNDTRISTEELIEKVDEFASASNEWIIDGNYISTMEQRIKLADTIILLDLDSKICVQNALARSKKERQADMAAGFDVSKISQEFLDYIAKFKENTLPRIMAYYEEYKNEKDFIILKSYEEIDEFYLKLKEKVSKEKD